MLNKSCRPILHSAFCIQHSKKKPATATDIAGRVFQVKEVNLEPKAGLVAAFAEFEIDNPRLREARFDDLF